MLLHRTLTFTHAKHRKLIQTSTMIAETNIYNTYTYMYIFIVFFFKHVVELQTPKSVMTNHDSYSRTRSTGSPSFCMTTFSASLTNLTVLLSQSHDSICEVNKGIMAPLLLLLQKHTDLCAHTTLRSLSTCDISLGSLTCA
jgi:hypothetical protein